MKTTKFKTNIKCSGCIATVKPYLNETFGEGNWTVDLESNSKVLTVNGEVDEGEVKQALEKTSYQADKISS